MDEKKRSKWISLFVMWLLCVAAFVNVDSMTVKATVMEEEYRYIELEDGTIEITGYSGTETKITIPSEIGEKSVTSIGDNAFYGRSLTSIEISDGIKSIGDNAFIYCRELTSIKIPSSVTNIGSKLFYACENLTSITVDAKNKVYNSNNSCNAIIETETNVLVAGCGSTLIPNGVIAIGPNAFMGVSNLVSIEIPNSVISIGDSAFSGCDNLTDIEIPNSVTSIGSCAFWLCGNLESIDLPDSVTSIGEQAFGECYNLTSIEIPSGVKKIEEGTFFNSYGLISIDLPDSVTSIGEYAFQYCSSLTRMEIPNNVTSIGTYAFAGCSSLTSIEIPSHVTSIGEGVFRDCEGLTNITVDEANKVYNSNNSCNAIIETATNTLIVGCASTKIPNEVTSIGDFAFSGCSKLKNITLPDGVTSVGVAAFVGCSSLTSIKIPNNVSIISDAMFEFCESLTSVEIPNGVTSIGENAFANCPNLVNIEIPNGVTSIGGMAFYACFNLKRIKIPDSVTSIGVLALSSCSDSLIVYADAGSVAAAYAEKEGLVVKPISEYTDNIDGADIIINESISTDDLFRDHPEALYNKGYNDVIAMLYEDCAEAVDIYNSDFGKQFWSSFKYGLTDGPEILVKSTFGSIFGDNIVYREFIDEEVEKLMASVSGNSLLLNEAVEKVEKSFDTADLIKDIAGNTYDATQKKKIINALADTKYFTKYKAKKLCELVEDKYEGIDKKFKAAGITISVADAIITVAQICSIKVEIVDTVMESIPQGTDLYDSLKRLRNRITSEEYLAYMIAEEKIFDEIADFVSTTASYAGIRMFSKIMLKEATPAIFFGELTVKTWAKMIPEASADDLVKANLNNGIFTLLSGAVNSKYVELVMLKQQGATDAQIQKAKNEYKILYVAHIEALKNAIETAEKLTEPSSLEKFYGFFDVKVVLNSTINRYHKYLQSDKELVEIVTYDGYLNSCLNTYVRKNESQYLYEIKDGKATIIGCSIKAGAVAEAGSVSVTPVSASPNAKMTMLNETNVKDSMPLKTTNSGEASYENIIMIPDAVEDIPVTAIESKAFVGTISNAVVVLPKSIESIAVDSFDSNSEVLIIGTSNQGIEECATATNNVAQVVENTVESIEIVSLPDKLTYEGKESLDETGMVLKVIYSDGTETEITKGWFSHIEQRQLGTNVVNVNYAGCSTSYEVTITNGEVRFTVYFRDEYGNDLREKHEYIGQFGNYYTVYDVEIPYYTAIEQEVRFLLDGYKEIVIQYKENETVNIENAQVSKIENQKYTGEEITPNVEVGLGGKKLTKNVDYELEYFSNIEEGTAEIIIWGIGLYSGEVVTSFQITKEQQTLGKEVIIGTSKYIITKDNVNDREVSWKGLTDRKKKTIKIPAEVKINGVKYKVTSIESNACKGNKKITKITIGKNVKVIGKNAFSGCTKLKKVTLGSGITTIKSKAFYKCTTLTKITIPKKVSKIEKQAFFDCKKLKNITIKSAVLKSVGKNAIKGINKKATIKVPKKQYSKYKKLLKSKTGYKKTMKIKK